jgi:hypothetical protein
MRIKVFALLFILFIILILTSCEKSNKLIKTDSYTEWNAEVYPAEHEITIDTTSGSKLIYVTTNSSDDVNLYFDYNCWFKDLSAMFFTSNRNGTNELFAYIPQTGELICVSPKKRKNNYWLATVDFETHDVYVRDTSFIYQWNIAIEFNFDSTKVNSVKVKEREIASAPQGVKFVSALTQSADRKYLSTSIIYKNDPNHKEILAVDVLSGEISKLMSFQTDTAITHVQFNKYNPNLLRYSRDVPRNIGVHRMWVVDIRKPGESKKIHLQEPQESVTHEDWWVNDQLTFCSGYRPNQYHVKVINIHDQDARIVGAGSWWEDGSEKELAEYNWWHASGSRDGKWIAADNWHGHIAIIDGRTSHLRLLTKNHRVYGGGNHPHVGWAPDSKSVEFTTNSYGNSDVCIAFLPLGNWGHPFMEK